MHLPGKGTRNFRKGCFLLLPPMSEAGLGWRRMVNQMGMAEATGGHCRMQGAPNAKMAGVAGLEPVTSAVTGQRSNQLSYTPALGDKQIRKSPRQRQVLVRKIYCGVPRVRKKFGQQTPRRWGWGTPLKKRTATRIMIMLRSGNELSTKIEALYPLFSNYFFKKRKKRHLHAKLAFLLLKTSGIPGRFPLSKWPQDCNMAAT